MNKPKKSAKYHYKCTKPTLFAPTIKFWIFSFCFHFGNALVARTAEFPLAEIVAITTAAKTLTRNTFFCVQVHKSLLSRYFVPRDTHSALIHSLVLNSPGRQSKRAQASHCDMYIHKWLKIYKCIICVYIASGDLLGL